MGAGALVRRRDRRRDTKKVRRGRRRGGAYDDVLRLVAVIRVGGGQAGGDTPAVRGAEAAARPCVRARRQLDYKADVRGRRRYLDLYLDHLVRVRVRVRVRLIFNPNLVDLNPYANPDPNLNPNPNPGGGGRARACAPVSGMHSGRSSAL